METIHIILGKANPDRMNGVNKVVYQLSKEQHNSGRSVQVWGLSNTPSLSYKPPFSIMVYKRCTKFGGIDKQLIKAIDSLGKDSVIHFHGSWIIDFSYISKVLRRKGLKYVTTPHGGYNKIAMRKSYFKKRIFFQLFEKSFVEQAQFVHCIGASEVVGLKSLTAKSNTFETPYGFELDNSEISGIKKKDIVFTFMGRLDAYTKGLDLMLDAFQKIATKHQKAKLWIIGDGDDMESLKGDVSRLGLSTQVKFWGAQFGEKKIELMKQSHVFIHPSRNEGLPSAILEASSLHLPTIASEATNVATFIRKFDAGWAVDSDSVSSLTKAMDEAIESSEDILEQKGKNAALMLKVEFNWRTILSKFDVLYKG